MYTIQGNTVCNAHDNVTASGLPRPHLPRISGWRWLSLAVLALVIIARFTPAAHAGTMSQGIKLQGIKLQGIKLQGIKLQGIKLQGIKLQGIKLQGIKLQGAAKMPDRPMRTGWHQCQARAPVGLRAMGYAMLVCLPRAWRAATQLPAPATE